MHNFKVGDKVVRKAHHNNDIFLHYVGPAPYVVTAVSTDGYFLCINNWENGGGDRYPWSRSNFTLVAEQDDPLPPAPESVRYNDEYSDRFAYKQTWLDVKQDHNQIYIETGQYGEYKGVGMVLSPDAALQLAHDLRRMAMEIRRQERNG